MRYFLKHIQPVLILLEYAAKSQRIKKYGKTVAYIRASTYNQDLKVGADALVSKGDLPKKLLEALQALQAYMV